MNSFQLLGLGLVAVLSAATLAAPFRRRLTWRVAVRWQLLWLAAAVAIAWPRVTLAAARLLGIARGADLVFYCAILSGLVAFFLVYLRLRRLEENLTELVRQLAIRDVREPAEPPGPRAES